MLSKESRVRFDVSSFRLCSRDPSSKLKQFTKEFKLLFPNAQRMNRGGTIVKEVHTTKDAEEEEEEEEEKDKPFGNCD